MRTLKEKHSAQDQNSEVALWIFKQKKSFGSYYEELVLSALSHTCMHILTTPLQSPCLPVVQALHSGIRALSLPSCVTETTESRSPCLSSADSTCHDLLLSLISFIICSLIIFHCVHVPRILWRCIVKHHRDESMNIHIQNSFLIVPWELSSS